MDSISKFILAFEKDREIKRKIMEDIELMISEKFKGKINAFTLFIVNCIFLYKGSTETFHIGTYLSGCTSYKNELLRAKIDECHFKSENVYFLNKKLENDYLSKIARAMDDGSFCNLESEMRKIFIFFTMGKNLDYLCWDFLY
jgi:hypothetical protein